MRAFLAIARRELDEKRFVFAAAVAASLVPFLVSMSRGLHGPPAREAQSGQLRFWRLCSASV